MRIYVSFDLDDGVDPDHDTGLTEEAFIRLHDALLRCGADDIAIAATPEEVTR